MKNCISVSCVFAILLALPISLFSQTEANPEPLSSEQLRLADQEMKARLLKSKSVSDIPQELRYASQLLEGINSKVANGTLKANDPALAELADAFSKLSSEDIKAAFLMRLYLNSDTCPVYLELLSSIPKNMRGRVLSRVPSQVKFPKSEDPKKLAEFIENEIQDSLKGNSDVDVYSNAIVLATLASPDSYEFLANFVIESYNKKLSAGVAVYSYLLKYDKSSSDAISHILSKKSPELLRILNPGLNNTISK